MSPTSLPSVAGDGDRRVPDLLAGVAVEADQVGVERRHVEPVAPGGEAAVDGVAAEGQVLGQRLLVVPELASRSCSRSRSAWFHGVVTYMMPSMTSGVHSKPSSTPVWKVQAGISRLDVLGVDLLERAVALGVVRAAVHQPVVVVGAGLEQVVVIDGPDRLGRRLLSRGRRLEGRDSPPRRPARR